MGRFLMQILVVLSLASCDTKEKESEAIARVGNDYLYLNDIVGLVPADASKEDSLLVVKTHIERWATQKLLTQAAQTNLTEQQRSDFEKLIEKYKIDLYTNAYLEQLVKTKIDTLVEKVELEAYYQENKSNFKTNAKLVKLRYISVPEEHQKLNEIKKRFFNPKSSDKNFWNTYSPQLNAVALNDSVWVEINQIYQKIPFINPNNENQYIQPNKKHEHKENGNVYLLQIKSVLSANQISPYDYIEPTIRQVILNKRKLDFIKKTEKEITEDAIKNNLYEIYE